MKKLAVLLALIMSFSGMAFAAQEETVYIEDRTLFTSDFEVFEDGEEPSALRNSNAVTPAEWVTAPSGTGGAVVEDAQTGNKYYRFYNNTSANVTATFNQTMNPSTQDFTAFKFEFDVRTMGVAFNVRFRDNASQTTYFVNLARNATSVFSRSIQTTQWNHIEIVVDDAKNLMWVYVNGILATKEAFQPKYTPGKGHCYFYVAATLYPGDEAFFDNFTFKTLKPQYAAGDEPGKDDVVVQEKVDYVPSANGIPDIKDNGEQLEAASWNFTSTRTQGGMTKFGHRTYVSMSGNPSYINEFDSLTGEFIASFTVGDKAFYYSFQPSEDGKIHHTNGKEWYIYDPATQKSVMYKKIYDTKHDAWGMNPGADNDRKILYTAHSGGTDAIEYNTVTGEYRLYENVTDGMKYMHGATGNDKYLFTSAGDDAGSERIIRVDKETGEKKIWHNTDPEITAGNCPHCIVVGDYVFAAIRQWVFCIDIETMQEVARFPTGGRGGRQRISYPMPGGDPDIIYFMSENQVGLNTFNLKTHEVKTNIEKFDYSMTDLGKIEFGEWIQKKDGTWAIYACVADSHVALITPGDPHVEYIELQTPMNGLGDMVQTSYFHVSRDDILYTGGYRAGISGTNLKNGTPIFSIKQNSQHGITEANGMIFGGTYSSGNFYMLDPEKPVVYKTDNPQYYYTSKYGCRHYNVSNTIAGFCMHCAIADYGGTQGGIVMSTYADGKPMAKEYGGYIPGENITGMCYYKGHIYSGSSVTVNLHEPHEEAHIAKLDARTGEPLIVKSYDIPGIDKIKVFSEIVVGPDGNLYVCANQGVTLLVLDPDTLELLRYKSYYKARETTNTYLGDLMIMGADGVLYNTMGDQLHAVNIETLEAKLIWGNCQLFGMDNEGNIYKRYGANSSGIPVSILEVDQRQRLDIMIQNAEKYYKEEDFSKTSWKVYQNALSDAKKIDFFTSSDAEVKEAARKLTFAIKDLMHKYDEEAGFAYVFGDNLAAFADMTGYADKEALHAVNMLKAAKIITGIDNKTYAPDNAITRAEFVKLLTVIEGCEDEMAEAHEFTDVAKSDWYYNYVQVAYSKGWIQGKSEAEFAPNDIITDEQMKLMLNRIKEGAFDEGKAESTTRAEAAKLLYDYLNI